MRTTYNRTLTHIHEQCDYSKEEKAIERHLGSVLDVLVCEYIKVKSQILSEIEVQILPSSFILAPPSLPHKNTHKGEDWGVDQMDSWSEAEGEGQERGEGDWDEYIELTTRELPDDTSLEAKLFLEFEKSSSKTLIINLKLILALTFALILTKTPNPTLSS